MANDAKVQFRVSVLRVTERAILIEDVEGDSGKVWLPRSQLRTEADIDEANSDGTVIEITIPEWLAIEKELL